MGEMSNAKLEAKPNAKIFFLKLNKHNNNLLSES